MEHLNIILADDNRAFLEGVQLLLSKDNRFRVIDICENGKQLVESPKLRYAHLVISDIEMPVLDGIHACGQLNKKYPQLPLIATTMYEERAFLQDLIAAGFRAYIFKPTIAKKLIDVIDMVLASKLSFPNNIQLNSNTNLL